MPVKQTVRAPGGGGGGGGGLLTYQPAAYLSLTPTFNWVLGSTGAIADDSGNGNNATSTAADVSVPFRDAKLWTGNAGWLNSNAPLLNTTQGVSFEMYVVIESTSTTDLLVCGTAGNNTYWGAYTQAGQMRVIQTVGAARTNYTFSSPIVRSHRYEPTHYVYTRNNDGITWRLYENGVLVNQLLSGPCGAVGGASLVSFRPTAANAGLVHAAGYDYALTGAQVKELAQYRYAYRGA